MQRGAQENLWPKLFSRAPRCAPLRLAFSVAASLPYRKSLKLKSWHVRGPGRNFYLARKIYPRGTKVADLGVSWRGSAGWCVFVNSSLPFLNWNYDRRRSNIFLTQLAFCTNRGKRQETGSIHEARLIVFSNPGFNVLISRHCLHFVGRRMEGTSRSGIAYGNPESSRTASARRSVFRRPIKSAGAAQVAGKYEGLAQRAQNAAALQSYAV